MSSKRKQIYYQRDPATLKNYLVCGEATRRNTDFFVCPSNWIVLVNGKHEVRWPINPINLYAGSLEKAIQLREDISTGVIDVDFVQTPTEIYYECNDFDHANNQIKAFLNNSDFEPSASPQKNLESLTNNKNDPPSPSKRSRLFKRGEVNSSSSASQQPPVRKSIRFDSQHASNAGSLPENPTTSRENDYSFDIGNTLGQMMSPASHTQSSVADADEEFLSGAQLNDLDQGDEALEERENNHDSSRNLSNDHPSQQRPTMSTDDDWLSSFMQAIDAKQRSFLQELRAENQQWQLQIISLLRNPHSVSAVVDAQSIEIIMPSQPNELPVNSATEILELNSKLKDDSALRAKLIAFYRHKVSALTNPSLDDVVRCIMSATISQGLSTQMSYTGASRKPADQPSGGKKGKISLEAHEHILKVLKVAIFGVHYKQLSLDEANAQHFSVVREKMMQWFYGACDRGGGRNRRLRNPLSESPGSASSASSPTSSPLANVLS